ncbi:MAG: thiamine pyrophosphate-dependent enzyme [Oceanococcaceae bacterium]
MGLLNPALETLLSYGAEHAPPADLGEWHQHIRDLKSTYGLNFDRESTTIQPMQVIEEINKITKGEAIISTGVGQHQMWAAQYFDFAGPRLWLTSGSMGTMGFGLPAAIGAQFAQRNKLVIDIDGDASIRMNLGELETVTTYKLPVKIVVLNNYGDGMVKQWQKLFFKGRLAASDKSLHSKDFIKAAEADGFSFARRVESKQELAQAVADFIAFDGPAFLEVIIDTEAGVYPMVGPGMSYAQMITGDHIPTRNAEGQPDIPDSSEMF